MSQSTGERLDLNACYHRALAGIHRAYIFMRFGSQGVNVSHFDDTELKGRFHLQIVPEPVPLETVMDYVSQFRAWTISNGLLELEQVYGLFLDEVYALAVTVVSKTASSMRLERFAGFSLHRKIQTLRDEMGIDGGFSFHIESFSRVRNVLAHAGGIVRQRDCAQKNELALTWRGIDIYFVAENGVRYQVGQEPRDVTLREPFETITVDRARKWTIGERVTLSAHDLAEICFMANHDAVEVLDSLREFGSKNNVEMIAARMIRGGLGD